MKCILFLTGLLALTFLHLVRCPKILFHRSAKRLLLILTELALKSGVLLKEVIITFQLIMGDPRKEMCDACCKYQHWILDFPLNAPSSPSLNPNRGVEEGAAKNPEVQKYVLPNSSDKNAYMPFCPPKIQTHAYVFKLIAYKKEQGKVTVTGRSQSMPLLFSLEH